MIRISLKMGEGMFVIKKSLCECIYLLHVFHPSRTRVCKYQTTSLTPCACPTSIRYKEPGFRMQSKPIHRINLTVSGLLNNIIGEYACAQICRRASAFTRFVYYFVRGKYGNTRQTADKYKMYAIRTFL